MKTGNCLRILGVWMLLGVFPGLSYAASSNEGTAMRLYIDAASDFAIIDSIPKAQKQDDKDSKKSSDKSKGAKKDAEVDKNKDPKVVEIDPKKPVIKQVPKARPKLRPGTVTDKVKIKRQPVRVKPGKGLRVGI